LPHGYVTGDAGLPRSPHTPRSTTFAVPSAFTPPHTGGFCAAYLTFDLHPAFTVVYTRTVYTAPHARFYLRAASSADAHTACPRALRIYAQHLRRGCSRPRAYAIALLTRTPLPLPRLVYHTWYLARSRHVYRTARFVPTLCPGSYTYLGLHAARVLPRGPGHCTHAGIHLLPHHAYGLTHPRYCLWFVVVYYSSTAFWVRCPAPATRLKKTRWVYALVTPPLDFDYRSAAQYTRFTDLPPGSAAYLANTLTLTTFTSGAAHALHHTPLCAATHVAPHLVAYRVTSHTHRLDFPLYAAFAAFTPLRLHRCTFPLPRTFGADVLDTAYAGVIGYG